MSERRTLVLVAFPDEADAVLARTTLDPDPVVVAAGRHFYLGTIGGRKSVVAMTGIGLVNAARVTEQALLSFWVDAVVFSGVAGGAGRTRIADVAVPARWSLDHGQTYQPVSAGMLATAEGLSVELRSVKNDAQLIVGGNGGSSDNNNGQAFPCIPNGGGVFGCLLRRAPGRSRWYTGNFFAAIGPFLARGLISNVRGSLGQNQAFEVHDMESAAAQRVADAHGVPFLGIRGISDGAGDPLKLPGFPLQFFFYKKIAAENAARVTEAFLRSWAED